MRASLSRLATIVSLGVGVFTWPSTAESQLQCEPGKPPMGPIGYPLGWPQGTTVSVFIDPSMPENFKTAVRGVLAHWDNAGGSGVDFECCVESFIQSVDPPDYGLGIRVIAGSAIDYDLAHVWRTAYAGRTLEAYRLV